MNNKINFALFSVIIMLSLPLITTVGAQETQTEFVKFEKQDLKSIINEIKDEALKTELSQVFIEKIDEDGNVGIDDILNWIKYLKNFQPDDFGEVETRSDLIEAITITLLSHIVKFPETWLVCVLEPIYQLLYDVYYAFDTYADIEEYPFRSLILEQKGAILLDYAFNAINDFKQLINLNLETHLKSKTKEAIKEQLKLLIQDTSIIIYDYADGHLGYINKFGLYIYNSLVNSDIFIENAIVKFTNFKVLFIDLPKSLIEIKQSEKGNLTKLINFGIKIAEVWPYLTSWTNDISDNEPELKNTFIKITNNIQELNNYYNSTPWEKPIKIIGQVKNVDQNQHTTISCTDHQTTIIGEGEYEISYSTTQDQSKEPAGLHTFTITAESNGKTKEYTRSAFSDGEVIIDIDFEKENVPVPRITERFSEFFQKILSLFVNFKNIFTNIFSFNY